MPLDPIVSPNIDVSTPPSSPTENYSWEQAATDPDLLPAIRRYAKNTEDKVFKDDNEALDWFKGDRRWKDSNTISALKELNRAAGGWGTVHLSKDDLQDLATIRDRWEKLPGGFSRIADGDIAGGVGAIAENVGKGLLDPSILLGGLASKAVTKTAAKIGVGMVTDAAVTGAANVAMQQTNKEVGLQKAIDWDTVASGALLGGVLSAPGHISVATKTPKKLDVDLALKQTQGGYETLKNDKNLSQGLFNVGKRDRIVPRVMAEEADRLKEQGYVPKFEPPKEPIKENWQAGDRLSTNPDNDLGYTSKHVWGPGGGPSSPDWLSGGKAPWEKKDFPEKVVDTMTTKSGIPITITKDGVSGERTINMWARRSDLPAFQGGSDDGWAIVGTAKADKGSLEHLVVSPYLQRQGLGTKLIELAETELNANPYTGKDFSKKGAAVVNKYRQEQLDRMAGGLTYPAGEADKITKKATEDLVNGKGDPGPESLSLKDFIEAAKKGIVGPAEQAGFTRIERDKVPIRGLNPEIQQLIEDVNSKKIPLTDEIRNKIADWRKDSSLVMGRDNGMNLGYSVEDISKFIVHTYAMEHMPAYRDAVLKNGGPNNVTIPEEAYPAAFKEYKRQLLKHTDEYVGYPPGEANALNLNNATEARMKDLNSLEGTLASTVGIPAPKVEETAKHIDDYLSGKLIHINDTMDVVGLARDVQGRFGDELFAKDPTQGVQTWAATEAAAKRGLSGKDAEKVAKDIVNLPRNYNPSAVESRAVAIVRAHIYDKWDEAAEALKKDPTNTKIGREVERLFDMWSDLSVKSIAMGSEAGRALRIRAYKTNSPEGLFKKAGETASKVLNAASGNKSTFTPDIDLALQLRRAVKSLTDGDGNVDPLKVDLFLTNLESQKLGTKDAWQEAWYNSLLSSPSTMAVNAIGNTVTTALNATEQTLGSVMAGQSPVSAFKNVFAGYMGSIREATKVAFNTFKTEIPFDPMTRMEVSAGQAIPSYIWDSSIQGLNRFRKAGPGEGTELLSLKGAWGGRQARIPGRALMAADDFAKVGHYRMGLYSAAVDEIKAEEAKRGIPYSQNEFAQLLSDKVARPSDSASDYARNIARTLTFTNDPGPLARGAQQIIDDIPMGRMIVPFVRTPANIVKFAADMVLPSTKRTGEDLAAGGLRREAAKARLLTGWSIMAFGVWSGYSGLSTGAGPTDKETRESWLANNLPWSVKIPWTNTQVQWNRLDPVALPFAIGVGSVDMIKAMNDPQRESAFWDTTAQLFSDAILDKTWFQGVQNVVNAVSDPSRKMDSFGGGIVRTFVPSVVAGMARAYDPRVTAPQTYMEIMQDRIGFDAREKVPTKLDVLGRPVKVEVLGAGKDSSGILAGAARMISPFKTMETNVDPVAKELADLRTTVKSPDKKWNGIELNSEQYYALSKAKGEYLYNGLKWFTESPDWKNLDKGVRRMMVEELNKEASKIGEVMLIGAYPELLGMRYSPDKNTTIKKFTNPTQEQLNDTVKSPFTNPKLQNVDKSANESAADPETFSETLGLTFSKNKKYTLQKGENFPDKYSSSLQSMLDNLSKNSENPTYREVAASILNKVPDLTVGVKENTDGYTLLGKSTSEPNDKPTGMYLYHAKGDKTADGFNEETALHEALHVALRQAMYTDKDFRKNQWEDFMNLKSDISRMAYAKGNAPKELWYSEAMSSSNEFLSYAMTNRNFQNYLKNQVRYKDDTSGWDVFKDIVGSWLGFDKDSKLQETELDRVMRASKKLIKNFPEYNPTNEAVPPTAPPVAQKPPKKAAVKSPFTNPKLQSPTLGPKSEAQPEPAPKKTAADFFKAGVGTKEQMKAKLEAMSGMAGPASIVAEKMAIQGGALASKPGMRKIAQVLKDHNIDFEWVDDGIRAVSEYTKQSHPGKVFKEYKTFKENTSLRTIRDWLGY